MSVLRNPVVRNFFKYGVVPMAVILAILGAFWFVHSDPETRPAGSTLSDTTQHNGAIQLSPVMRPDATGVTVNILHFEPNAPMRDVFELKAEINRIPDGSVAAFVFTADNGTYVMNRFLPYDTNDESGIYRSYLNEEGADVRLVITHPHNLERLSKLVDANGEYRINSLERDGLALLPVSGTQLHIPFLGDTP